MATEQSDSSQLQWFSHPETLKFEMVAVVRPDKPTYNYNVIVTDVRTGDVRRNIHRYLDRTPAGLLMMLTELNHVQLEMEERMAVSVMELPFQELTDSEF